MSFVAVMHVLNQIGFVDVRLCYDAPVSNGFRTALPSETVLMF